MNNFTTKHFISDLSLNSEDNYEILANDEIIKELLALQKVESTIRNYELKPGKRVIDSILQRCRIIEDNDM